MSSSIFIAALAALAPLLPSVSAHGQLAAAEAAGTVYQAPNVYYAPAERNAGTPLSAMYPSNGKAWNGVGDFGDANAMACEGAAVPPGQITVTSGGAIRYYFNGATSELLDRVAAAFKVDDTPYPFVHAMGSVAIDIASCGGDCANVNPADLNWNRILYDGLDYGATVDGGVKAAMAAKPEPYQGDARWGLAALIARGSWVEAIIPADLVAGNYLTRVELAAVHDPKKPQLYIGCANTVVQGAGTKALTGGTNAGALYSSGGALAQLDVYSNGWSFNGDGPALLDFASTPSTNTGSNNSGSSGNSDNSDSSDSGSDNTDTDTEKPTEEAAPTTEASTPAASTEEPAAAESSAAPSSCRRRRRRNVTKRASSAHKRAAFPHMHSL